MTQKTISGFCFFCKGANNSLLPCERCEKPICWGCARVANTTFRICSSCVNGKPAIISGDEIMRKFLQSTNQKEKKNMSRIDDLKKKLTEKMGDTLNILVRELKDAQDDVDIKAVNDFAQEFVIDMMNLMEYHGMVDRAKSDAIQYKFNQIESELITKMIGRGGA